MKKLLFISGLISQALLFGHAPEPEKPCQITPPYSPLSSKVDFTLDLEFLYWYSNVSSLAYANKREAIPVSNPFNNDDFTIAPVKKERFKTEWDPGVRAGLGIIGSEDGWDLYVTGLYFDTSTSSSNDATPDLTITNADNRGLIFYTSPWLFSSPDNGANVGAFSHMSASWSLSYYQIDAELGRKFWISSHLTLRPFVGLRGFDAEDTLKVRGYRPLGEFFINEINHKVKATQKNWGVGLLSGINTNWHVNRHWSVYGNASVALTYGRLSVKAKDRYEQFTSIAPGLPPLSSGSFNVTLRDEYYKLMPIVDLAAGIQFETPLSQNKYRIILSGGWETHFLIDHNEFLRGTSVSSQSTDLVSADGDLTLSGFTLRGRLDF